jgi:hypothetical protein
MSAAINVRNPRVVVATPAGGTSLGVDGSPKSLTSSAGCSGETHREARQTMTHRKGEITR